MDHITGYSVVLVCVLGEYVAWWALHDISECAGGVECFGCACGVEVVCPGSAVETEERTDAIVYII